MNSESKFTWDEAKTVADAVMLENIRSYLSDIEVKVLWGSWEDESYQEIADQHRYTLSYINKDVGNKLWKKLSEALGEKVTKKNFKEALKREWERRSPPSSQPFYVERPPIESRCYDAILQPGALIRIKAPQQMGKTLLLDRILAQARERNYQTVTLSFELQDSTLFNDMHKFSQWFCAIVGKRLGLPNKLADYWDDIFSCNDNSTTYLEEYLLAECTNPIVLALDKVDRVFEKQIANDFCCLLRGWYDLARRSDRHGAIWKQLRLIVVHSTEVYSSLDINHSPLANVGVVVPLPEFTPQQVQHLARRYGMNWTGSQVEQLIAMVGGHPYLVREAFDYLQRQKVTLSELLQIAPTDADPFGNHLRQHLGSLQQHPELAAAYHEVVTTNNPVKLESAQAFKLQSMGLVQLHGDDCSPRCDLYRRYFSVRLGGI